jgi:hypothetical protein
MKASEVYRAAAERIWGGTNKYSCVAIALAAGTKYHSDRRIIHDYSELFLEGGSIPVSLDLSDWREWRITALCLMAAIAESEGD